MYLTENLMTAIMIIERICYLCGGKSRFWNIGEYIKIPLLVFVGGVDCKSYNLV